MCLEGLISIAFNKENEGESASVCVNYFSRYNLCLVDPDYDLNFGLQVYLKLYAFTISH
jgi:hypothetical protein